MKVLFLGPCRKYNRRTGEPHRSFDPRTPSGKYVSLIKNALRSTGCEFRLSNVIDETCFCATERDEKNPTPDELISNWKEFERRLKHMRVDCIVAFGSNVRSAFARVDGIDYLNDQIYNRGRQIIVFAPHPSFVMIYRRKVMNNYIRSLSSLILRGSELGNDFRNTEVSQSAQRGVFSA